MALLNFGKEYTMDNKLIFFSSIRLTLVTHQKMNVIIDTCTATVLFFSQYLLLIFMAILAAACKMSLSCFSESMTFVPYF